MSQKLKVYLDPAVRALGIEINEPRAGDAGIDLRAASSLVIEPGKQALVPTGLRLSIPDGWVGIVKDRSSMALKRVYTHAGVIDAGYRGEVKIVLSNNGENAFQIEQGDKIAQIIVVPCLIAIESVRTEADLGSTERGSGGFGSTGK